ncbi:14366_t:CDS:2 [Entrophospora sp. SA101]|nr:14366_t:CDS:2 [Entrophospora sp. SA101]
MRNKEQISLQKFTNNNDDSGSGSNNVPLCKKKYLKRNFNNTQPEQTIGKSQIIGCDKKENNIDTNTTTFDNTENNIDTNTTTFDNTENNIGERRRTKRRYREAIKGITKPAIRRLAHSRNILKKFLKTVIKDVVVYTEHANRSTVTLLDVGKL